MFKINITSLTSCEIKFSMDEDFIFHLLDDEVVAITYKKEILAYEPKKLKTKVKKVSKSYFFRLLRYLCNKYNIPAYANSQTDKKRDFYGNINVRPFIKHGGKTYRNAFALRKGRTIVIATVEKVRKGLSVNFYYNGVKVHENICSSLEDSIKEFSELHLEKILCQN